MELAHLSRRERQIMDGLFRLGKATAAEIRAAIADPPSYTAVRTMLRILEDKGAIRHEEDGRKFLYIPVISRVAARKSALRNLLDTFFGGSANQAAIALLGSSQEKLSEEDFERLEQIIEKAKRKSTP